MTKEEIKQELLNDAEAMECAEFIRKVSKLPQERQHLVKCAVGMYGLDEQIRAMKRIDEILANQKASI